MMMADLEDLSGVSGEELTVEQINGILNQIDLDITNLLRDGKLSALKYAVGGEGGRSTDRAANLQALLAARGHYQKLKEVFPTWQLTQYEAGKG